MDVKEGQLLQVSCIATTGDEPLTIEWFKDDSPLSSSTKFLITPLSSAMSLLILSDVGFEHSGRYSCEAVNPAGRATVHAHLQVQGKPQDALQSYLL